MESEAAKGEEKIVEEIVEELKWASRVNEKTISVKLKDGVVVLEGTADSWAARHAAEQAAHRVSGVRDVANEILVRPRDSWLRSDAELAKAVRHALEWSTLVPDERIQTTVSDGIVTLEGTVDTWDQHDDAIVAVRNLKGVFDVRSKLVVEPAVPAPSPEELKKAIRTALVRHARHAASHVEIEVVDGRVILRGNVPSAAERAVIGGVVRGTRGVAVIDNRLQI